MSGPLAVILAGGEGKRLRPVVSDVPKPLAPIAGRPFIHWLLDLLSFRGIKKALFLLGYKASDIISSCGDGSRWGIEISYSVEDEPLDKGGALRNAIPLIDAEDFLLMNGDTLLDVDYCRLLSFHRRMGAAITFAVRPWKDLSRVDPLDVDEGGRVKAFGGKNLMPKDDGSWLVNGGVYGVKRAVIERIPLRRISWEGEIIPALLSQGELLCALEVGGFFIDIGVPEDYARAQREIPAFVASLKSVS